jgi:c-di-AMP phosphodiesterase-like protein
MQETFRSLTSLIKEHERIVIMTHKNIDLDGFGSALCLYTIIKSFNKECYICLNKRQLNKPIIRAIETLKKENILVDFLGKSCIKETVNKETLLIILDTYKKELLEDKVALQLTSNIVIIDHHIVNNDYIIPTRLTYINSNLSSTNEIMVNYLKYLNKVVHPSIATIMLAGIEIDTNSFKVKTTETTYEAAAFLTSLGANNVTKQDMLKENKDDYLRRLKFVKKSYMVNKETILCTLDDKIVEKKDLATIAENLLQFEDVESSFVIGKISKNVVGVSARSLGNVDVFKICKKLGGGGHMTNAAVQINDVSINEVKKRLLKIIN